ncbi:MAG: serine hydrolase domain-containing protein [Gammaproteobacteria bacterium]
MNIRPVLLLSLCLLSACTSRTSFDVSFPPQGITGGAVLTPIHASNFNIDRQELNQIKRQMQRAVDAEHFAGALLWVGNREGVGVHEAVGTQTPAGITPVNKDTIFRIYSMTKPVISVAAMSLVEDGLLGLDDPVSEYLPSFANLRVIDPDTGTSSPAQNVMTVRHLLTHQSGIVQQPFAMNTPLGPMYRDSFPDVLTGPDPDEAGAEFMREFNSITALELATRIGQLPVLFEPGTAWHYGHSTDVLGAVLEVASSQPLDRLLQERIFDPLGMEDTSFWVPTPKAYRIAEPIYGPMTDNTIRRGMLAGGHGLNSTAEDYARFSLMLLNGGRLNGNRIISERSLDQMRQKTLGSEVSRDYFFYGDSGDWGLGFHLQPTTGDANGPHNFGWRGIGGTIFIVDEENDFYLVYMVQKWGGPTDTPFTADIATGMIYEAMRD